jgi:hypothetical protein
MGKLRPEFVQQKQQFPSSAWAAQHKLGQNDRELSTFHCDHSFPSPTIPMLLLCRDGGIGQGNDDRFVALVYCRLLISIFEGMHGLSQVRVVARAASGF